MRLVHNHGDPDGRPSGSRDRVLIDDALRRNRGRQARRPQSVTINGVDLEATVSDLENPAKTDTPPSAIGKQGQYWVRVTATLTNKGSKPLDSFDAGFQLIDSKGQRTYGNDVTAVGPAPQLSGTLLPGDKLSGAVVFLVPNDAQPEEVRLSSLGGGGVPARWSLK